MTIQGGGYSMLWFDTYSAGVSLLCSAFFEAAALVYIYGIDRFCEDFKSMVGFRPPMFWQICWKYISPVFLLVTLALFHLA
jgi:SNF family Na+-dependent transporter